MKQILSVLFSFFISYSFAQVDTAQVVVSGRYNSPAAMEAPYVILISADGMRYDYMQKYKTKNLLSLAKEGVWAKRGMVPSYPSITFPNHYSIVTGLYPSHHGIVDNIFYDPQRDETYRIGSDNIRDGSWYGGTPLWSLAGEQGMVAASLFWVGSESVGGNLTPTYYYNYHEKFTGDQKVNIIKNWLKLPAEKRPHFITLYFSEVDTAGHKFGPDASETRQAVQYVDETVGKLVRELSQLDLPISYVFVSDHGMVAVTPDKYIPMPVIDKDRFVVINSNTFARITAKNKADIMPLYQELSAVKNRDYNVYLAENFPEHLHYSTAEDKARRIGDIILVPQGKKILTTQGIKPSLGKHGFDPDEVPEMKASFVAWGDAFKKNQRIRPFTNVDVYPLIARILGLRIEHSIDGNPQTLKPVLRK